MNAPRTPTEIMKERFAAAVIHTPHSAPDSQHAEEDPDLHRNAPRPDPACLYGLLGRVAEAGSETTEANPHAVAFNALVYLSAGIGRGPFLPVGNTWHHANLFGLHVGRSGRGRKATLLAWFTGSTGPCRTAPRPRRFRSGGPACPPARAW